MKLFMLIFLLAEIKVFDGSATRLNTNIYTLKTWPRNRLVVTKGCWETAFSERAIVRYDEKNPRENKIIFVRTGKTCEVLSVTLVTSD